MSTGEQVTIGLLSMALNDIGVKARSYTGNQVRILTDNATPRRASSTSTRPTSGTTSTRRHGCGGGFSGR
ncbi:MAG: hypothetical protein M5R42_01890 [Rhodocyclaceae bacterium]|nr:hypothetical protein [Rhodocyclaceae bacterium]